MPTAPEVGETTELFLDVLRTEQFRYLDAMAEASEVLRSESGRVALIAALQNRLTQQFFDAQRSIIARQAMYDVEVQRIEARAETDVQGIVAAARSRMRALAQAGRPLAPPAGGPAVDAPAPEPGVALARRTEEALAGLPDESIAARQPDPDAVQRQLGALLDQWWAVLNQDGQTQIDHAHARAAMRRHVAAIESGVVEMSPSMQPPATEASPGRPGDTDVDAQASQAAARPSLPRPTVPLAPPQLPAAPHPSAIVVSADLPSKLLQAIESAPIADLRALLESLEQHFQPAPAAIGPGAASTVPAVRSMAPAVPPAPPAPPAPVAVSRPPAVPAPPRSTDLVILEEASDRHPLARLGSLEPATMDDHAAPGGFWSDDTAPNLVARINRVIPIRVVLPMIAATSAITLVLALVG